MTKYVVSGYIGFDNFGDEAIASVLVKLLKDKGAERITLISSNPQRTSSLYDVDSCGMFGFCRPIISSDVLISGGGSLLQDVTSLKSLIYYLGVIYFSLFCGKKVEIFAQGIGPINSKFGQVLTKLALKRASKISVRDKKSQELLKKWNIDAELVQDPIFTIDLPIKNKKGVVGIQLRNFPTLTEEFLERFGDAVAKRFKDKNIQIFSLQDSIDLEICQKFEKILIRQGFDGSKLVVLKNLSIKDVLEKISNLEYMIGMRFHSNVVAIKAGVKTMCINYDIKVQKLAEEYHLPIIKLSQEDFSQEFSNFL